LTQGGGAGARYLGADDEQTMYAEPAPSSDLASGLRHSLGLGQVVDESRQLAARDRGVRGRTALVELLDSNSTFGGRISQYLDDPFALRVRGPSAIHVAQDNRRLRPRGQATLPAGERDTPAGYRGDLKSPTARSNMPQASRETARIPPRWVIRLFWIIHRRLYDWSGGRVGLRRAKPGRWGTMRLTTVGRRTGRARAVMLGYFEDGSNLVTMAMNGWGDAEPGWWLNLQAAPDVTVELVGGPRQVSGRAAQGDERERLWARWQEIDKNLDGYAARRSMQTAVVVLEPRSSAG
jgi:deazaflavin-dependent oxidoreductase (nitroreductase family)